MRNAVLLVLLFITWAAGVQPSNNEDAEVNGTVTDYFTAAVVGASVEFVGQTKGYMARAGMNGKYSLSLPPGIYGVKASAHGFCNIDRAEISVTANQRAKIDFVLPVNMISMESSDGPTERYQPGSCYKEELLSVLGNKRLRPLILYGGREKKTNSTYYYSGLILHSPGYLGNESIVYNYPVVFTYDLMTVRTDRLTLFSDKQAISGTGNVPFQEGEQSARYASKIYISFHDGKPKVRFPEDKHRH